MKYADRLKDLVGVEGRLYGSGDFYMLEYQGITLGDVFKGTIKEIGDDFVVIGVEYLDETYEVITPLNCLTVKMENKRN